MSKSMVERVARAIALAALDDDTRAIVDPETWPVAESYYDSARAAIEAMREPTDEMIVLKDGMGGNELCDNADETVVRRVWTKLIDAALTPAKVDEAG